MNAEQGLQPSATILVVDDTPDNRTPADELLREHPRFRHLLREEGITRRLASAPLNNIGKPSHIRLKSERLSAQAFERMKTRSTLSRNASLGRAEPFLSITERCSGTEQDRARQLTTFGHIAPGSLIYRQRRVPRPQKQWPFTTQG